MLKRSWYLALVLLAGMTYLAGMTNTRAVAQQDKDAVTLKWEFTKDKPIYQDMTTTTKQSMKVMGMDVTQNQSQEFIFSLTPKDKDAAGNWTLTQKIEAVKMNLEMGGNTTSYDSTKEAASAGNPLADLFKALVGSEFKLTVSPEMKVTKIEGRDEFLGKLVKANPQMEPLLKQILGDEALKQMSDPAFAVVPGKPVKKGDTWERKSTLNMGPIGGYDTTYKYTYEGKEGALDKIKVDTTMTYQTPGPNQANALPFKIKSAKLESKNATGTVLFDNAKHRVDKSDLKLTLEGTLSIDIGGMATDVSLTQDQTTSVKTSDTNPVTPAKK